MNRDKTPDYLIRRVKFFSCKLTENDMQQILANDDYFEHYSEYRWGNNLVEHSRFDEMLDKKKYLKMRV